ncbi:MAG: alpha-glucosidase, partial [Phycisphaerae bacterium]|nr:alpha-glucosidase [Phycisphaerae bacterium]
MIMQKTLSFVRLAAAGSALALVSAAGLAQVIAERVGDGMVQYHASEQAKAERLPSLALVEPVRVLGKAGEGSTVKPTFSTDDEGRQVTTIEIGGGTTLYGTGQAAGPLRRNGRVTQCWNLDAYGYQDDAENLYTSHPWVVGVREDGTAFGVLADTTWRVEIDLSENIVFRASGPAHPVIVVEGAHPKDVMLGLGELTGTIEMPPKWAVGYHQCRYSYYPDSRVREIANGFREREIPADVIWMDIDYMDGFRCFTFDENHFPDPKGLNDWLDTKGFSNVWMIDPGLKNEEGYFAHDQGTEIDAWVQTASGEEFNGHVWPGECVFPDFTNQRVREWWSTLYHDFMAKGIDGVWNDMNEPA